MTAGMLQSPLKTNISPIFLSEIFLLNIPQPNLICFRLTPRVDTKIGNRFSWRFSQKFPDIIVIFSDGNFWVLAKPDQPMPNLDEWRKALTEIQDDLKKDIGDRTYSIQWVSQPQITASILAQLAVRVLKVRRPFSSDTVWSENKVEVKREVDFWAETIEIKDTLHPAIAFTIHSSFVFKGDLAEFYENHPYRQDPNKLLIGLKVRDIEKKSSATIVALAGIFGERREELFEKATGAISKQKLEPEAAPDDQPVVTIQFGKDKQQYLYPMAALIPCVTEETADLFEVKYSDLRKQTKIPYQERQNRLASSKQEATNALAVYGFQLAAKCINNGKYPKLFLVPTFKLEDTLLQFGKNMTRKRNEVLKGLSTGGVYRRHKDYQDTSRKIRIAALKIGDFKVDISFLKQLRQRLKDYDFESLEIDEDRRKAVSINGLSSAEARAKVEKALDDLIAIPTDIVLTFLPQTDRHTDNSDDGSLYTFVSSRLLRRSNPEIVSQVIYEDTLKNPSNYKNILNQVIVGILAKLGNSPFILAEPLGIADYFIGLDISRKPKKKTVGSRNVCASVRLYGKQGDFIRYRLEDVSTEGEEIDKQTLERFLPSADISEKTVLIYRDGRFCGSEVEYLQERAKAINSKFILVECIKSGIPRLYNYYQSVVKAPTQGLALRLSSREVILVTTKLPSENMGLPYPLRLRVHEKGHQAPIEDVIEATLKLTLLHHGALKEPRLPVPLYGSDRIAYRRLQGIIPNSLNGDRQFWL